MPVITLTQDQLDTLQAAERILHDLLPTIDGLQNCDIDCQQMLQQNDQIRSQIDNLRKYFAPGATRPQPPLQQTPQPESSVAFGRNI
jgi:hypothetical protein